ncbi:MAG: toll/interleukin-1 receptor domain-containing protein [Litorimonas sp.]
MSLEVFMSYSHKDEALRDELETHLAMLKRQGLISVWHDRRILSGQDVGNEIDEAMLRARLILFLVSPDFLASDYCYDVEVESAIRRHNSGDAHVIPVILRPCEWQQVPLFKKLLGAPTDNRAVTKWPDRDEAFLDVTTRIRNVIKTLVGFKREASSSQTEKSDSKTSLHASARLPRSSNLSAKQSYSQRDKDSYLDDAYAYIRQFFEGSLEEFCARNTEFEYRLKDIDNQTFSAKLYQTGRSVSTCHIYMGGSFGNGIAYSSGDNFSRNSMNEQLSVEADDQKLYLTVLGLSSFGHNRDSKLTHEGGAELFWSTFIRPVQPERF